MPASAIERFRSLLADGVQVITPYGATEALPVCSIGSDEILGETRPRTAEGAGVCVGRPVEGMAVRIIRISDEPIADLERRPGAPRGEIGEIVVQGPVVTRIVLQPPGVDGAGEDRRPRHGGFWHRMGDLGYLDEQAASGSAAASRSAW